MISEQSFEHCLAQDRYALQQQAVRLQRLADNDPAKPKAAQRWQTRLQRSQMRWQQRQASVPSVTLMAGLPITDQANQLIELISQHPVVIVAGETGSGKTTQLPKLCLQAGRGIAGMIGHTQPRRIAARSVAARIADELQVVLGQQVGFQVRFSDHSDEGTLIKLMTDGILLAQIQQDPYLRQYDTLIIDEAHERSLNIDFLLGYLKQLLPKRPDLRLIITSATIDVQRFAQHFNQARIVQVQGRSYPVTIRYLPPQARLEGDDDSDTAKGLPDLPQLMVQAVQQILQWEQQGQTHQRGGDMLCFLPGERQIKTCAEYLRSHLQQGTLQGFSLLPLYSRLSAQDQQRIFKPSGQRRIVLSTNIAETSLTVPGIYYVIDSGWVRMSRYSYRSKLQRLPIEPISQASANQRAGRCGRLAPGLCVRLYSEDSFQQRPQYTDAEILRTHLGAVILRMAYLKLGSVAEFPFIDAPDSRLIKDGYHLLAELGAFSDTAAQQAQLTPLGHRLAQLPVDPRIARMLIEGHHQGALSEVLVIASALSTQDVREYPQGKRPQAEAQHQQDLDAQSDFIGLLNLWRRLQAYKQEATNAQFRQYCQNGYIHYVRWLEWQDTHRQLKLAAEQLKLRLNTDPASYQAIHTALLSGLLSHIAQHKQGREYQAARNRNCVLHPGSAVARNKRRPQWIVAAQLVETSQVFAQCVAAIEPHWVEPLAKPLLKYHYLEPHWRKKPQQAMVTQQVMLYGLTVIANRLQPLHHSDPALAREYFIRHALVEGQCSIQASFLQHNQRLQQQVEYLEAKSRRRDLWVDDQVVFDFYAQQLPQSIFNGHSFCQWLKGIDESALYLHEHSLQTPECLAEDFPDQLVDGDQRFALTYRFEPGHLEDGLSIQVPLMALAQLTSQPFDWLVPGRLRDKCIALVKTLPKALRKQLAPVPDVIDLLLPQLQQSHPYSGTQAQPANSLTRVLGQAIYQHRGLRIADQDWDLTKLDDHYRLYIQVMDEQGQCVAAGRDIEALSAQVRQLGLPQADQVRHPDLPQQPSAHRQWVWDELPLQLEQQQMQMRILSYPALVAQPQGVVLQSFQEQAYAQYQHRRAVVRLLSYALQDRQKWLQRNVNSLACLLGEHSPLLLPLGDKQQWLDDFFAAVVSHACLAKADTLPRSERAFQHCLRQGRAELADTAQRLGQGLLISLQARHRITQTLQQRTSAALAFVYDDIQQQMAALLAEHFLRDVDYGWLCEYPRYFAAIEQRLAKGASNRQQQLDRVNELQQYWHAYQQAWTQMQQQYRYQADLVQYRWLLEEYRVSLFAQALGTKEPISAKRLHKYWQQVGC